MLGIGGTDQGGEATTKVSNRNVDSGNGADGIRKATNDDRVARSIEVDLRAREKPNGIPPNASELVALGGVQKKLFATVLATSGSEGGEEIGGGAKVGSLRQREALDGAIAAAIDISLARHDKRRKGD